MNRRLIGLALTTALVLPFGTEARSEPIRFTYSYSVVRTGEAPPQGTDVYFSFAPGGEPQAGQAESGTALSLAPISLVTTGLPPATPIPILDYWSRIGFGMQLKDITSGEKVAFVLGGELAGGKSATTRQRWY